MSTYQKILLATDFSESAKKAAAQAVRLARQHKASLHVLHVDPTQERNLERFEDPIDYVGGFGQFVKDALGRKGGAGLDDVVPAIVRDASASAGILRYAQECGIDLIVLGTRGRQPVAEKVLGSVAQRVMREAPVSVLLVGPGSRTPTAGGPPVIVAPVDLSARSSVALEHAAALAAGRRARLIALYVIDRGRQSRDSEWPRTVSGQAARRRLEAFVAGARLPIEAEPVVGDGRAAEVIFDVAARHGAELIVLAPPTPERAWLDRVLLGSVTRSVAREAPAPVLVHRRAPATKARREAA